MLTAKMVLRRWIEAGRQPRIAMPGEKPRGQARA
jgi:hypothetical protein